jgi:hypothetical protein
MPQVTTNKSDWSGDDVTVQYDETATFELYGYTFTLGRFVPFGEPSLLEREGVRELFGDQWGDDTLTTLPVPSESLEQAVIAAIKWISNHV